MKKFLISIFLMNLVGISSAWSAPQNLVVCNGPDGEGGSLEAIIHQDEGGQLVALIRGDDFNWGGGITTIPYKIEYSTAWEYSGDHVRLTLEENAVDGHHTGYLNVSDLSIDNQKMTCLTFSDGTLDPAAATENQSAQ